jgi:hypothetical protein
VRERHTHRVTDGERERQDLGALRQRAPPQRRHPLDPTPC